MPETPGPSEPADTDLGPPLEPAEPDPEWAPVAEPPPIEKPRRARKRGVVGTWLLATGGCLVLLLVLLIGGGLVAYYGLREDGALHWVVAGKDLQNALIEQERPAGVKPPPPDADKALPPAANPQAPPSGPTSGNPAFLPMVKRLCEGRWIGKLADGGTITYDYRADAGFTLRVDGIPEPIEVNGRWRVTGVGLDSVRIERKAKVKASAWFQGDDHTNISFPGPNLMRHALKKGSVLCAREGSGAKPELPADQANQEKVTAAVERLGGKVDTGDGILGINLKGRNVTDDDLAILKDLANLTALDLTNNPQVTDAAMQHLQGVRGLDQLLLNGTGIGDAGLAHIKGHSRLRDLYCGNPSVTDVGIANLHVLTDLRRLDLSDSRITDEGLVHLGKLSNLKGLLLQRTEVTDAGLAHLHGLKLQTLSLAGTKTTDGGVEALRKAIAGLNVMR